MINTGLEFARRIIPGTTRIDEALGHRSRAWAIQKMVQRTRGDRRYRRHDRLAGARAA